MAAWGQTANEGDAQDMIANMIRTGGYSGFVDKELGRMGDAAAVAVTKVLGGTANLPVDQVDTILTVIHLAFAAPQLVEVVSDREPRTALLVLRYLDLSTSDVALKGRIAEEARHVREQYAKVRKQ